MEKEKWTLPPHDDWDYFAKTSPPPIDWVIKGLKPGNVGIISAPGGTGKSMFCLSIAQAVNSGKELFGVWPVGGPGDVVYLYGDDDPQDMHNRVYHLHQLSNCSSTLSHHHTYSFCVKDNPPRFMVSHKLDSDSFLLSPNSDAVQSIKNRILLELNLHPRLLIFDPLNKFHALEENSNNEMEQLLTFFGRFASELGAAIILLHHTGKSAVLNGQHSQQSARGASAIIDQARWHITLRKFSDDDAARYNVPSNDAWKYLVAHNAKINGAEPLPDLVLERGPGGVLVRANLTPALKVVHRKGTKRGEI